MLGTIQGSEGMFIQYVRGMGSMLSSNEFPPLAMGMFLPEALDFGTGSERGARSEDLTWQAGSRRQLLYIFLVNICICIYI